jgi:DNA-binding transcriptional regulator of glucitol operon
MNDTVTRTRVSAKSWFLAVLVLVVAVAIAVVAVQFSRNSSSTAKVELLADGVGVAMQSDKPYGTFYLGSVCLAGKGEAEIVEIEPIKKSGPIEVSNFSAFPFSQLGSSPGADLKPLDQLPQFKGSRKITESCGRGDAAETQLALEVHVNGPEDGVVRGLRIRSRSGGKTSTTESSVIVGLCRSEKPCE